MLFRSGLTPIIATALLRLDGGKPWYVCGYVILSALLSAWAARAMERRTKPFDEMATVR